MVGREAYSNPMLLSEVDQLIYAQTESPRTAQQVVLDMLPYIELQMTRGARLWHIVRHMLGLFQGMPGARQWRRLLSEQGHLPDAKPELLLQAMAKIHLVDKLTI